MECSVRCAKVPNENEHEYQSVWCKTARSSTESVKRHLKWCTPTTLQLLKKGAFLATLNTIQVHRVYYPALAWPIKLLAYAMPSIPVPPIIFITNGHGSPMQTTSCTWP